jgi:sulfur-oxidizing protein SoxZ
MASEPKPRIKVPKSARAGEVIVIKTLIGHEMETGLRKDKDGNLIPRKIINKFTCEFNGQLLYSCDLEPAISANPFFEFSAKVSESGTFKFTWVDDDGTVYAHEESIEVN